MDGEEKEMHHSEKNVFNEFLSIKTKDVRLYARIDLKGMNISSSSIVSEL